jgi:MFS family permease
MLIATQGVLYALGCGLLFSPISLYLDDWFVERKGLAYGTMWAAKSAVGVVTPFLMRWLLDTYGAVTAIRIWVVASVVLTLPLMLLLRPRVPVDHWRSEPQPLSFAFVKLPIFWMLQFGNMIQSLGYLMPSTYLASYASFLGLEGFAGSLLLSLFSVASVPGSIVFGPIIGDRMRPTNVILISSLGSAIAVFVLWGLSVRLGVLAAFSILYGFFAGAFSTTWSGVLKEVKRMEHTTDTGLVFGLLMGFRGIGFVLSGPVSGVLLDAGTGSIGTASSYASKYSPMIICTGATAVLGAWGWLWTLGKPTKRLIARLRSC